MAEVPHLVEVQNRYAKKGVQVVGVTAAGRQEIDTFTQQRIVTYPILASSAGDMSAYGIRSIPTTYLVDPSGQIVETGLDAIEARLEAELGE